MINLSEEPGVVAATCNATSTREAYFKASLGYVVGLGSAWSVRQDSFSQTI